MAWRVATIANCKKASIRRTPWIPLYAEDITGIRDGPKHDGNSLIKMGQIIEVNDSEICYDWTDRKFYRTKHPKGWIHEGCIVLGADNSG